MDLILQYIMDWVDALWLPVAVFLVHKDQRIVTAAYILSCMFTLRLQAELLIDMGFETGFIALMNSHVMTRGLIVYAVFHILYLITAYFSPGSNKHVFLAASISIFFAALLTSMVIMML